MLPTYMKKKGDVIYYDGDGELIYYIPEKYFSTNNAIISGEYITVFGLFNYGVFDSNGKNNGLKMFNYPTMITCKPTSISKESEMLLKGTHTAIPYTLLHFKKGSELICSTRIPQDVTSVEKYINLLFRANLPENIKYEDMYKIMDRNAQINGVKYNLNYQMYGIPISEICRDPKDLSKPFRLSKETDPTSYKAIPITQIPKYVSPYTSITSENADEAIASAITSKNHTDSPLEKVMMN